MNDFEELQKIYEEGYRGQSFDPIKPANAYPAQQDWGPYSRPIPGSPEASGYSAYRQNMVGNKITHIIDEELPDEKQISNRVVIAKIEEIIDTLDPDNQSDLNGISALSTLKGEIITL